MDNLLALVQTLAVWAYLAVFLGMLLESLGLPLPGQTLALVATIIAAQGQLNFWLIYLLTIVGGAIGAILGYWLGHKGGRGLIHQFGRFFGITPPRLLYAEEFFSRHGYKTLLVSRYLPVLCFASGLLSGIFRLPFRRFWLANLMGVILWASTHLVLGLVLGNSLHLLTQILNKTGIIIVVGVILVVIFMVIAKNNKQRKIRRKSSHS